MTNDPRQKVQASHLKRNAYLYVRQSTLRQVFENTESTKRQYGLRQRAIALGSSISPNLLGSARSSSDDSLERTRATREMSLRSLFPPQRVHWGSPESATTPTRNEKGFLQSRHRYS